MYGGSAGTTLVGIGVVLMYYDGLYATMPPIDTTTVAGDIVWGQAFALTRAHKTCGDYGCVAALALWWALGTGHIVAVQWIPPFVAHIVTACLLAAQCAFATPNFGFNAVAEDIPVAYLRSAVRTSPCSLSYLAPL